MVEKYTVHKMLLLPVTIVTTTYSSTKPVVSYTHTDVQLAIHLILLKTQKTQVTIPLEVK